MVKKIRIQEIVHAHAVGSKGGTYEVVVPCLDFKPENFSYQNAVILRNDNRHVLKIKLYGATFFIIGDFYGYDGKKNDRYDISRYLERYKKHYFDRLDPVTQRHFSFAFYIREIDEEDYEGSLKERCSA